MIRPVRLALLEQHLVTLAARWPAVMHAIIVRAVGRAHALALNVAINSLQHVDLRLLVLFWHLADRFGRVTPDGTIVPIKLSHGDIAELIGARRPSVSAPAWRAGRSARRLRRRDDRHLAAAGRNPRNARPADSGPISDTDSGPAAGNVGLERAGHRRQPRSGSARAPVSPFLGTERIIASPGAARLDFGSASDPRFAVIMVSWSPGRSS